MIKDKRQSLSETLDESAGSARGMVKSLERQGVLLNGKELHEEMTQARKDIGLWKDAMKHCIFLTCKTL